MKALVLAGGKGTRLRPITFTRAKQLVPVANKPILFYALEAIAHAGIADVGVIVGDTAEEVVDALGDGSAWGLRVTYIPQEAPLGLAHAVKIAEEFIGGEPFVMYLGDNLIAEGVTSFTQEFRANPSDAQILLAHVPNANHFGVAELAEDGSVVSLVEKPENPASDLALVGVYLFGPAIFEAVNAIEPSARGELEITDAIQWLIDHERSVRPHVIDGWWKDTGRLEDMLEANRIMLDTLAPVLHSEPGDGAVLHGRVSVGEGTTIVDSVVRGPAIIGDGCTVRDAYIGPYSAIGDGCEVAGSEIEHSIMLAGSRLENLGSRLTDSLLGVNAVVRRTPGHVSAARVMIGDNSEVDLG